MLSFRSLVVALLATLALVASARAQEESTPSTAPADTLTIDWAFTANQYPSAKPNAVVAMVCPSADRKDLDRGYIWGTDIYTDDSRVCWAAVHAGLIELDSDSELFPRTVLVVEYTGPQESYVGTERNEVTTTGYGPWPGSFRFVLPPEKTTEPD